MQSIYPARFQDRFGTELTSITNDGQRLSILLRGVEFATRDFEHFEPAPGTEPNLLSMFVLEDDILCSGVIDAEMPIPLVTPENVKTALLLVQMRLDDPPPGRPFQRVSLQLLIGDRLFRSSGTSGDFEGELLDLQQQLPKDTWMKACINCAFSDYAVDRHATFGNMMCFRNNKQAYLSVRDKFDYLHTAMPGEIPTVQETFLCLEFERRRPGTGYRG